VAVAMLLHNKRRCELMTLDESSSNVSNDWRFLFVCHLHESYISSIMISKAIVDLSTPARECRHWQMRRFRRCAQSIIRNWSILGQISSDWRSVGLSRAEVVERMLMESLTSHMMGQFQQAEIARQTPAWWHGIREGMGANDATFCAFVCVIRLANHPQC
jgi:hypothetical protein